MPDEINSDSSTIDDKPAFTEDQNKEMIRLQNAALSAHHSRAQKVMDQKLETLQTSVGEMISTTVAKALEGFKPAEPVKPDETDMDDRIKAIENAHKAEMKALNTKLDRSEQTRLDGETAGRASAETSALDQALRTANVPEGLITGAAAVLHTVGKRVVRDAADKILLRFNRNHEGSAYTEDLELDKGVAEWLATPEGKFYAPAKDVAGSGATGGGAGGTSGKMSKADKVRQAKHDLVRAIVHSGQ